MFRGGALGGNSIASQLSNLQTFHAQSRELLVPYRGRLLAIYDAVTLEEDPPPEAILKRMAADAERRLYAKVIIEGYESLGPQYIHFRCPPEEILKDSNGMSAVQRAEEEFDLEVIIPAKNPGNAYIAGKLAKSVRTPRSGLETPEPAKTPSLMASARVFDIIGV